MKKLQRAIDVVNKRYANGLNDDDAVSKMCAIDKETKGYTFMPRYDKYELCTDFERLEYLCNKYGYWSKEVEHFNGILRLKSGFSYMSALNVKITNK